MSEVQLSVSVRFRSAVKYSTVDDACENVHLCNAHNMYLCLFSGALSPGPLILKNKLFFIKNS